MGLNVAIIETSQSLLTLVIAANLRFCDKESRPIHRSPDTKENANLSFAPGVCYN